jgi:hypothetical protein
MLRIPFTIPNLYADFAEAKGVMHFEQNDLILEFQTKDTVLGLIKSDVKEERIALEDLHSVGFNKKFFKGELIIKARKMHVLGKIPGSEQGEITLIIARKDRDAAAQFAVEMELIISEYKLKKLDEEADGIGV